MRRIFIRLGMCTLIANLCFYTPLSLAQGTGNSNCPIDTLQAEDYLKQMLEAQGQDLASALAAQPTLIDDTRLALCHLGLMLGDLQSMAQKDQASTAPFVPVREN